MGWLAFVGYIVYIIIQVCSGKQLTLSFVIASAIGWMLPWAISDIIDYVKKNKKRK